MTFDNYIEEMEINSVVILERDIELHQHIFKKGTLIAKYNLSSSATNPIIKISINSAPGWLLYHDVKDRINKSMNIFGEEELYLDQDYTFLNYSKEGYERNSQFSDYTALFMKANQSEYIWCEDHFESFRHFIFNCFKYIKNSSKLIITEKLSISDLFCVINFPFTNNIFTQIFIPWDNIYIEELKASIPGKSVLIMLTKNGAIKELIFVKDCQVQNKKYKTGEVLVLQDCF